MKVYLVASALPNWMRTGYGHSLLAAEHPSILVSFAEYLKVSEVERLTLAVPPMSLYQPVTAICGQEADLRGS